MGFFKKIFKGIGKVFKKIGKGIKSAFKKFGKFMGKIGVLGQVAMMFILPGVGQLLGKAWSAIAGQTAGQVAAATAAQTTATAAAAGGANAAAATAQGASAAAKVTETIAAGSVKGASAEAVAAKTLALGSSKATGLMAKEGLAKGIGKVMQFTGKVVGTPGKVFSSITQGVTDTLGNFAKTASNNIFGTNFTTAAGETLSGKFFGAGDSALASESAFGRSFGKTSKFQNILTKAPTTQTLEAVDSYKTTLDSLNKIPDANLKDNFDANDLNLMASNSANPVTNRTTTFTSEMQDFYNKQNNIGSDRSYIVDAAGKAVTEPPPLSSSQSMLNSLPTESGNSLLSKGADSLLASPVENESILSRLGDVFGATVEGIKNTPSNIMDKVENFAADPVGKTGEYLFGSTGKAVRQGVNNQLLQGLGLVEKPVAPVYETTNTYVAPFETTTPQMFEAAETMSPMAFAQNVTGNPSPYGYTAFQYNQYMNRTAAA